MLDSAIMAFFANYPTFDYDEASGTMEEFYAMCDQFGWADPCKKATKARRRLYDAIALDFNTLFGEDVHDLGSWQGLCAALRIKGAPQIIKQCKEEIQKKHVNIVDLVDAKATGRKVRLFGSRAQLAAYTVEERKVFPKKNAKAGGLLKSLLREIY